MYENLVYQLRSRCSYENRYKSSYSIIEFVQISVLKILTGFISIFKKFSSSYKVQERIVHFFLDYKNIFKF